MKSKLYMNESPAFSDPTLVRYWHHQCFMYRVSWILVYILFTWLSHSENSRLIEVHLILVWSSIRVSSGTRPAFMLSCRYNLTCAPSSKISLWKPREPCSGGHLHKSNILCFCLFWQSDQFVNWHKVPLVGTELASCKLGPRLQELQR